MRGATRCPGSDSVQCAISIHAPRAGCDSAGAFWDLSSDQFQSTHPVRGATPQHAQPHREHGNFNPRTPCGVRQSDNGLADAPTLFQSTHPVRGATLAHGVDYGIWLISIHAPRAGCDRKCPPGPDRGIYFNPRTPCGVRRQPLLSHRSTHNFNPRTPCGVRRFPNHGVDSPNLRISIHAPRAGCDLTEEINAVSSLISIHAPRAGCDMRTLVVCHRMMDISIHAPRAGCDSSHPR